MRLYVGGGAQKTDKVRKRIEEAFGWLKTVGGLAKTQLIGHAKLAGQGSAEAGEALYPWRLLPYDDPVGAQIG